MYLLKYSIYIFIILFVFHSMLNYYNIDMFDYIFKSKINKEENINIEENIKDLQQSLKELEQLS